MLDTIRKFLPMLPQQPAREPASSGHVLALTGAVVIHTEDGHTVVLTPQLARSIAEFIPQLAAEAEKGQTYVR